MMGDFPNERLLVFPNSPSSATARDGEATLNLVFQAANLVRDLEDRLNENAAYAQSLTQKVVEKLRAAGERIRELQAAQGAAQVKIDDANVMAQKANEDLRSEQSRARAAEEQARRFESRVESAEARASELGKAVAQVEDAIRTQLLGYRAA
jgi:chromosome segregation ATPase